MNSSLIARAEDKMLVCLAPVDPDRKRKKRDHFRQSPKRENGKKERDHIPRKEKKSPTPKTDRRANLLLFLPRSKIPKRE
jgi:hypothetical protein